MKKGDIISFDVPSTEVMGVSRVKGVGLVLALKGSLGCSRAEILANGRIFNLHVPEGNRPTSYEVLNETR